MGDAVAIGDLACITSYESWGWGGEGRGREIRCVLEREEERGRAGRWGEEEEERRREKRRRALSKEAGSINDINQQHLRPPARLCSPDRRADDPPVHSQVRARGKRRRCAHASPTKADLTPTGAALPLDYTHPPLFPRKPPAADPPT